MGIESYQRGFRFSNPQVFVPWGASLGQLADTASPRIKEIRDGKRVIWEKVTVFGSLASTVYADFDREGRNLNVCFEPVRANPGLSSLYVGFEGSDSPRKKFSHHYNVLKSYFDKYEHNHELQEIGDLAFARWQIGKFTFMFKLSNRFGFYTSGCACFEAKGNTVA